MRKILGIFLVVALIGLLAPMSQAEAQIPLPPLPENCFVLPGSGPGSVLVCLPPAGIPLNGDAVIYDHGYVPQGLPLEAAWLQLVSPDGTSIPGLVTQLGFVFLAPTYNATGLAVVEALQETIGLAAMLKNAGVVLPADLTLLAGTTLPVDLILPGGIPWPAGMPLPADFTLPAGTQLLPPLGHVLLVGASEGGLITTLAMEIPNTPLDAGVAACGPVGDFRKHVNYLGDFRVLFDYFFKNVLPPSPVDIPPDLTVDWLNAVIFDDPAASAYQSAVLAAVAANPGAALPLITTSKAPIDPANPATLAETTLSVLHYNVVATMDAQVRLGMQPYTNLKTWYSGSKNDIRLNRTIQRIPLGGTEAQLATALAPFQTSGKLQNPLVSIHTIYDPEVPIWHQALYRLKVWNQSKASLYNGIPVYRYGHCNFTSTELVFAFALAYVKGTGQMLPISSISQALPSEGEMLPLQDLMNQYGPVFE